MVTLQYNRAILCLKKISLPAVRADETSEALSQEALGLLDGVPEAALAAAAQEAGEGAGLLVEEALLEVADGLDDLAEAAAGRAAARAGPRVQFNRHLKS